ncbi:dTDP-4-dehydrorhamnose reductase [Sphingomonas profundi]|uniref:dTDP-4-dehydrorhamnose reductase n=1 Tax=Alterirhizorhabdus profundi TaxID=2681549 RepID=UPI0012E8C1C7|nr:dTDP-4-dehydrorhamnose reductase [Sphingomonas profundi]
MPDLLVVGGGGQLGRALARTRFADGLTPHLADRAEVDLARPESIADALAARPYVAVINAAAYTAVDAAENDVAAAFAANATGPALLADATRRAGLPLIHVSTDYVFDGTKAGAYDEGDPVAPLGVYGASKLAGEYAVLSGNPRAVVLRTAWVVSPFRSNFVKTMLRLAAERPLLRVVDDQRGCPTSADDIAATIATITARMVADAAAPAGVYHFVNAGEGSWCDLARAVMAASGARGGPAVPVEPIATSDFPTPARRPANSRLATARLTRDYGVSPRDWRLAIGEIVAELVTGTAAR